MKIYALVIGRKDRNIRYVVYAPTGDNQNGLLAVYEDRAAARSARTETLKICGHKDVFVVPFCPERS